MKFVLLALVAAALVVTGTSGTMLKLLPAVKASLLRHVDQLRHIEHHVPNWNFHAPQQRPWAKPSFHGSFSYQASANGGLPTLPLPFFPKPRPSIILVPCRDVRAPHHPLRFSLHQGHPRERGAARSIRIFAGRRSRGRHHRRTPDNHARSTKRTRPENSTRRRTTPATDFTATADLVTRADDVTTVKESTTTGATTEEASTVEPTIERKANTIPAQTDTPTTTEQPPPVTPSHFNDLLKNSMFGKLKEASTVDRKADIVPAQNPTTTEQPPPVTLSRYHYLLMKKYKEQ
ncbi:hypothetical protein MRX96_031966 [Rhipicephalus microplus]